MVLHMVVYYLNTHLASGWTATYHAIMSYIQLVRFLSYGLNLSINNIMMNDALLNTVLSNVLEMC